LRLSKGFRLLYQEKSFLQDQVFSQLHLLTCYIEKVLLNFFGIDLIECFFSPFVCLSRLVLLADVFISHFVVVKLHGVVVVTQELVVSVNLVSESAFLGEGLSTAPSLMSSTGVWQ